MSSGCRVVIFGLTVSSSWGNGHATLWRGLIRSLAARGHVVTFFEKDVPYYRNNRDLWELPGGSELRLYDDFEEVRGEAGKCLQSADVAICTSYCPDGASACALVLQSGVRRKIFYDLDTPVTLRALQDGGRPQYLPVEGLGGFDLVLSYTGGRALHELESKLGAQRVVPLYGWVDPETHHPVAPNDNDRCDLSYLGTYSPDRQPGVERFFVEPARRLPERRFLLGGAQYPDAFPWTQNIFFHRHVPPAAHPAFFCSSRWTLNVTRAAMAEYGYCPSGRLFEAAACGCPLLSDRWEGIEEFFTDGEQIVLVREPEDVLAALKMSDGDRLQMAEAARTHVLERHTADARAQELESLWESPVSAPVKPGGEQGSFGQSSRNVLAFDRAATADPALEAEAPEPEFA